MTKKKTIFKSFSLLAGITIAEKIIAFVFEAIIAAVIGTNIITDGYFTTAEFFSLIDSAFLSAITVVALNRYSHYLNTEGPEKGFSVLSDLQSFYLPLMVALSVLIFALAKPLSYVIAPGYAENGRAVVVRCIRVMSVIPSVVCITSIGLAVLRQKKSFGITGLKSLFISVVGIISVLVFGGKELKNADLLSFAFVISAVAYCIFVSVAVRKTGRIRMHKPAFSPELRESMKMLLPLMISYGVGRLALMVDKVIASTLAEGSVSALTYSHSLYKVVGAIFVTNLSTIILTDFNNLCANNEIDKVKHTMRRTVSTMTLVLLPISVVTVFNAKEIVKLVYERGKFSPDATAIVGGVLLFYAINFVPVMIQGVYNQALYAFGDTFRPMIIAIASVLLNLGTSLPLAMTVGLPGVAIGTVVSTVGAVIMGRAALKKYLPGYKGCYSFGYIWKSLLSLVICAASVFAVSTFVKNELLSFALSTAAAFLTFAVSLVLLREDVTLSYLKALKKKMTRKK